MSSFFSKISLASAALGLASLGILYGLHYLKQQNQRRVVTTLLFWNPAFRLQQPRVLAVRQFTHRKTFLLLATILLLLSAAVTADRWGFAGKTSIDVLVVDAGVETSAIDSSGRTLLQRMTESAALDFARSAERLAVVSAGPQPVLLGQDDEPAVLASHRLAGMLPQDGASESSLALLMADGVLGDREGRIHWYTSKCDIPTGLPERVVRRIVLHSSQPPDQAAITSVAFEPMPNDASYGKLRVRVVGNAAEGMPSILKVQTQNATAGLLPVKSDGGEAAVIVNGVVADGQSLTLKIQGASGATAAHEMTLKMPDRRPLSYRFVGNVPTALKLALLTVGVEATGKINNVDVFFAEQGTPIPPEARAAILVVNGGVNIPPGVPLHLMNLPVTRGIILENATSVDGPSVSIGGTPLIMAGHTAVTAITLSGKRPTLLISHPLVGPAADLPKNAAFPLLIGRLCDMLTGRSAAPATVSKSRAAIDPLWQGSSDAPAMDVVPISDRPVSLHAQPTESSVRQNKWAMSWTGAVLIAAMVLLVIELLLRVAKKIV